MRRIPRNRLSDPVPLSAIHAGWTDADCYAHLKAIHRRKIKRREGYLHGRDEFHAAFQTMLTRRCGVGQQTLMHVVTVAAVLASNRLFAAAVRAMEERGIQRAPQYYTAALMLLEKSHRTQGNRAVLARLEGVLEEMLQGGVPLDVAHHTCIIKVLLASRTHAEHALPYFLVLTHAQPELLERGQPVYTSHEERYMNMRDPHPDAHTGEYTYPLLHQAYRSCITKEDVEMLWKMTPHAMRDAYCVLAALRAAARLCGPQRVRSMLLGVPHAKEVLGVQYYHVLMDADKRHGTFEAMADQLRCIYEDGLVPNQYCFDTFIRACLDRAQTPSDAYVEYAAAAFQEADALGQAHGQMLYSSLIEVYAKVGAVDAAAWLQSLREQRNVPASRRWFKAMATLRQTL
eukprot:TRINITY_DN6836_c0_g1_i1.p1 TRINITY_DN6836_c0_g1~~TRINITY_DN6836_c0_g1_i1.p1  ORF type:complete len:401 (+),score=89.11 TRINITY_DN6836_c0_g1_i1:79-1281(+)